MMRFLLLTFTISLRLVHCHGFSTGGKRCDLARSPPSSSTLLADGDHTTHDGSPMQTLGSIALASVLSFGVTPLISHAAEAYVTPQSSSVIVSDAIKTLDMSLPSYGSISDAKATVETVQGLAVEPEKESGGSDIGGSSQKKTSGAEKAVKKKEALAAKQKAREAFEQEQLDDKSVQTVDFSTPSYEESTSRAEKSAFSL